MFDVLACSWAAYQYIAIASSRNIKTPLRSLSFLAGIFSILFGLGYVALLVVPQQQPIIGSNYLRVVSPFVLILPAMMVSILLLRRGDC